MDRSLGIALVGGALGLALMAGVASIVDPPLIAIASAHEHEGTTVRIQARLLSIKVYETGWTRFVLADSNATIDAEAPTAIPASPGDEVEARGRLESHNGRFRFLLDSGDALVVLRPWREHHIPLARILGAPWEFQDANVLTSGVLTRTVNAVRLVDPQGTGRIALAGVPATLGTPTAAITIAGIVEYDPESAAFRIRVEDASIESGESA